MHRTLHFYNLHRIASIVSIFLRQEGLRKFIVTRFSIEEIEKDYLKIANALFNS